MKCFGCEFFYHTKCLNDLALNNVLIKAVIKKIRSKFEKKANFRP